MADVVHAASGGGGGGGGGGEVLLRVKLPNGRVTSVRAAPADCVRTGMRVSIFHPPFSHLAVQPLPMPRTSSKAGASEEKLPALCG